MPDYIYITGTGTDPGARGNLNDPLFSGATSLGACMPNIRRFVDIGDHIFVVSGAFHGVQQYVVGGMEVAEKISAIEAYGRFPQNRLHTGQDGSLKGNIIINADGTQHPLDRHDPSTFENRIKNFVVGTNPVALETKREVELGRQHSLDKLSDIFGKQGNRPIDIMGRWAKLETAQSADLLDWLKGLKDRASV